MTVTDEPAPGLHSHATVHERAARGKAVRRLVPLEAHADAGGTHVPLLELVTATDGDRMQELLPLRYERMLASAFSYYRGSAGVMAADLATVPRTELTAQLCGDAHLSNFGVYASPERRLVFDVNDFDETLPGPFEWDVKRLAVSVVLAGRESQHHRRERREAVGATVRSYRTAMRDFAGQGNLAVWYASAEVDRVVEDLGDRVGTKAQRRTRDKLARAHGRDSVHAVRKLTVLHDGAPRFVADPPLLVPVDALFPEVEAVRLRGSLMEVLSAYRETLTPDRRHLLDQYRLVDIARKVVGTGSVGTGSYVLLLLGRDDNDPLVLQAKEAGASALEPYCSPSTASSPAERVVLGQRLVQAVSDIFLGWQRRDDVDGRERHYYVRQLLDGKLSAEVDRMDPRRLTVYGALCGWTLARAHARSGDRVAIAAYLGKSTRFDDAVTEYAEAYADRVAAQYQELERAVADGTVTAAAGGRRWN